MLDASAVSKSKPDRRSSNQRGCIELDNVSLVFGEGSNENVAVQNTTLTIKSGEFVCILGPSGCGKSTLLNTIAGFVSPTTGVVKVDDEKITEPGPDRGMVFQQYSLLPWKTTYENIALGPKLTDDIEQSKTVDFFLDMVGLANFRDHYPAQLSGGMQQRVGIARALATYPSVLLMDEPFGALDAQTRLVMQESLLDIWSEFSTTVVFVTHDVDESVFLADRILLMSASPGEIVAEIDNPLPRPRSPEMATREDYVEIKKQCLDVIRSESLRAFKLQNQH